MRYTYTTSLSKIFDYAGNRKIYLFGTDYLAEVIYKNILSMGRDIEAFIDQDSAIDSFCEHKVINAYELMYEEKNSFYVVAFRFSGHAEIYSVLKSMGLEIKKDFWLAAHGGIIEEYTSVDSLLGFTREDDSEPFIGYKTFGDSNEFDLSIVTLGGSTSDPTMGNVKTWSEQLYDNLSQNESIVVYAGGLGGYGTGQELLKFIRDWQILKPDIVITLDGYNDVFFQTMLNNHPYMHRYYDKCFKYWESLKPIVPETLDMRKAHNITHGPEYSESDVNMYLSNIRSIHAISEEFGIKHFAILQPMILSGNAIIDESIQEIYRIWRNLSDYNEQLAQRIPLFVQEIQAELYKYPYITDFTNIFDGLENVYMDVCHYTEYGHGVIANKIQDLILSHK